MDDQSIRSLVRALSVGAPRRHLLVGLFAAIPLGFGVADIDAKKKKRKKRKNRCKPQCAGKTCGDNGCKGSCGECSDNLSCDGTSCVCPTERVCGAVCCPAGELCVGGVCKGPGTCQAGDNLCPQSQPVMATVSAAVSTASATTPCSVRRAVLSPASPIARPTPTAPASAPGHSASRK